MIVGETFERDLEKKGQLWKNKPPGEGHKALQTHKKIAQGPLRAIEWIGVEKNRHIKALQGSIIDHFTL